MKCANVYFFNFFIFCNLFLHDAEESALETRQINGWCQGWNDDCSNITLVIILAFDFFDTFLK